MRLKIRNYISNCLKCIEFSPIMGKREGYLRSIPKGDRPFSTIHIYIHIDHLGPLGKTKKKISLFLLLLTGSRNLSDAIRVSRPQL